MSRLYNRIVVCMLKFQTYISLEDALTVKSVRILGF